jgi:hypothetical protein
MQHLIGCWSWDEANSRLVRSDGATLRFIRDLTDKPFPAPRRSSLFEIECRSGKSPLLVEHRLLGFHSQYRKLYWRASLARFAEVGGSPPTSYAQSRAYETIAADGLLCWPSWDFGEVPDWVGVDGGWDEGAFRPDRYRLYEQTRATKFLGSGYVPETEPAEPNWSFRPGDGRRPVPDLSQAARSPAALSAALDRLAETAPMLVAGDRAIIFAGEEYHHARPIYVDPDFVTDRFDLSPAYRGQERYWSLGEFNKVQIGTLERHSIEPANPARPKGLIWRLFPPPAERDKQGRENWQMDPRLKHRSTEAFASALFKVPEGENVGGTLAAPPLKVILTHGWLQGGYLPGRVEIARSLATEEFVAAFAETVAPSVTIAARSEVRFDPSSHRLEGPSGQILRFERYLGVRPGGDAFLLRCARPGIDWPVPVVRSKHVREKLARWTVDHEEALSLWRSEDGRDLPDAKLWDILRQFLEDALLSWPDSDAVGPAAQEIVEIGGFYDGSWHGPSLIRTITRPMVHEETKPATLAPWIDYRPSTRWARTDDLPYGLPERSYDYWQGSPEPPIAFAKKALEGDGRLEASVFHESKHRDEVHRTDFADFRANGRHLRVPAVRSRFDLCRVWVSPQASPTDPAWPMRGDPVPPDLETWRALRDAAESGLRPGEEVTVTGMWLFNRFFCGFGSRKLECLANPAS